LSSSSRFFIFFSCSWILSAGSIVRYSTLSFLSNLKCPAVQIPMKSAAENPEI
jgi:hypothetical protein